MIRPAQHERKQANRERLHASFIWKTMRYWDNFPSFFFSEISDIRKKKKEILRIVLSFWLGDQLYRHNMIQRIKWKESCRDFMNVVNFTNHDAILFFGASCDSLVFSRGPIPKWCVHRSTLSGLSDLNSRRLKATQVPRAMLLARHARHLELTKLLLFTHSVVDRTCVIALRDSEWWEIRSWSHQLGWEASSL